MRSPTLGTKKVSVHKNIPIFIPHLGCPHACVFCDQRAISGRRAFDPAAVAGEIEGALATLPPGAEAEIAYFGGSFTAIDRGLMLRLLDIASGFVAAGRVSGIRCSTRPDAVGEEVLDMLSRYPMSAIELGLQSMDDRVLALCERGHTAEVARDACCRIVARGIPLVGQMMVGLPGATPESELATAREICDLGATAARVYPTVVLEGTALAAMTRRGDYLPLTSTQAALRCAPILRLFEDRGVKLLRVGLQAGEGLSSDRVIGGADHPALGELCYGALFELRMKEALDALPGGAGGKDIIFDIPVGRRSQATGQHRRVVRALEEQYGLCSLALRECSDLEGTEVRLSRD